MMISSDSLRDSDLHGSYPTLSLSLHLSLRKQVFGEWSEIGDQYVPNDLHSSLGDGHLDHVTFVLWAYSTVISGRPLAHSNVPKLNYLFCH